MPERITAILQMLEDGRRAQAQTNELLTELRIDVAQVKRSVENQAQVIEGIRDHNADIADRLREAELKLVRLPGVEREIGQLRSQHAGIETRVRQLETSQGETKVVTGAVTSTAKEFLKHAVTAVVGAALAAAALIGGK